jgi:hypothetical protein
MATEPTAAQVAEDAAIHELAEYLESLELGRMAYEADALDHGQH